MIIPTDYNLLENVSFYDPVDQRIYFKREFWQSFFPRLRYDFKQSYGSNPTDMTSFVRDIKTKIFQYYYKKFVKQEDVCNLFVEIETVFKHHGSLAQDDDYKQHRMATVLERQDTASTLVQVGRPSSPTFVDKLLDHFSAMEERSAVELSMQVTFDEFARHYESESDMVSRILSDHETGKMAFDLAGDGFIGYLLTADSIRNKYGAGIATVVNLLLLSDIDDGSYGTGKHFSIDRFHFYDKRHSSNEVYRCLVQRIGREKALYLYENFMRRGKFFYQNVSEYVFSCWVCTTLIDLAKHFKASEHASHWMGKIKRTDLKKQQGLGRFGGCESSGWKQIRQSEQVSSPVSEVIDDAPQLSGRTSTSSDVLSRPSSDVLSSSPVSPSSFGETPKSPFSGRFGSVGSAFSSSSQWSGFGGGRNPR